MKKNHLAKNSQIITAQDISRYQRQIQLPEIGLAGQKKLAEASVLCVGGGGLGSPLLTYLAAAGIGSIGMVDDDTVELNNLHRQVFFDESDCGSAKVEALKNKLSALNQQVDVQIYRENINDNNVKKMIAGYDVIVDGTDNFAAKYLLNDACYFAGKKLVSASVFQFSGQLSAFAFPQTPCYRCVFPQSGDLPACDTAGILGVVPGIFGLMQANEVIKLIVGVKDNLLGKLLQFNLLNYQLRVFTMQKDMECALCSRDSGNAFARDQRKNEEKTMEISVKEFAALRKENYFLLDVRNDDEYIADNLGGLCIPLKNLPERLAELPKGQLIIVHCHKGIRGGSAAKFLQQQGYQVKNLTGGLEAFRRAIL